MKRGLTKLVSIKPVVVEQFDEMSVVNNAMSGMHSREGSPDEQIEDHVVFSEDSLREISRER